jgi:hypothetical protein
MFLYRKSGEMGMMGCRKMALSHIPTISSHCESGHGSFGADQHARPPLGATGRRGSFGGPWLIAGIIEISWGIFQHFWKNRYPLVN